MVIVSLKFALAFGLLVLGWMIGDIRADVIASQEIERRNDSSHEAMDEDDSIPKV